MCLEDQLEYNFKSILHFLIVLKYHETSTHFFVIHTFYCSFFSILNKLKLQLKYDKSIIDFKKYLTSDVRLKLYDQKLVINNASYYVIKFKIHSGLKKLDFLAKMPSF